MTERGLTMSLKVAERPSETKIKKSSERLTKATRFRMLARGYKALKKDKADVYEAAAQALEEAEQRSKRPAEKPR